MFTWTPVGCKWERSRVLALPALAAVVRSLRAGGPKQVAHLQALLHYFKFPKVLLGSLAPSYSIVQGVYMLLQGRCG